MVTGSPTGNSIRLTLLGDTEFVSLSAFLDAVGDIEDILRALGPAISSDEGQGLEWAVVSTYTGSLHIEIACVDNPVIGAAVAQTFIEGMEIIGRSAERPPLFSDYVLEKAKHLSGVANRGDVARIMIGAGRDEVHISQHVAANVDTLIGVRYEEIGSVEGRIEAVNIHKGFHFGIYDFLTERRVDCSFPDTMLGEVVTTLGKRAIVYGLMRTDARGEPISIRVDRIQRLRSSDELPSVSDLRGIDPDFTGGVDAAEYIRTMRDA
ncbi:MAG: hypothetical protein ACR2JW_21580 [Thermomicrobiales bacterium]